MYVCMSMYVSVYIKFTNALSYLSLLSYFISCNFILYRALKAHLLSLAQTYTLPYYDDSNKR